MEERLMLEMKVKGLAIDPSTNMPIVILKDLEEERALPIWVGIFEANAIALEMESVPTPRPMTHDLIKNILEETEATVLRIVVNDLKDNTFYAEIYLSLNGNEVAIDSRPSDAIALALRVDAPIYVAKKVLDEARSIDLTDPELADDKEKWKEWLEDLRPEDFGKYEM
ncbi:MAG: bifunctional nuclease family protein [bacterium]|nr:bifunctional nuclease family protein [bacterium]